MIITVDDIKRESENKNDYRTVDLPFGLTGYYDRKDKRLALYNKQTDIVKQGGLTHREASAIIYGVITGYRDIRDDLFEFGLID